MNKGSCSFNMVKLMVNEQCQCLIGMLDTGMRTNDNIDPYWEIEICKLSVICSFPYIGKSNELDCVRKSAHEVISGPNYPS